jgi:hypothetical protein
MSDAKLEITNCIRFWEASLEQHRLLMSLSAIAIVEQSIKYLRELDEQKKTQT